MRALEPEVVDAVWAAIEPLMPAPQRRASAGLSPAPRAGPVVLPGDPDPARDRRVVGRHRSDPRASGVGHDVACPTRRMDRRRGVRSAQGRGPRRVRSDHRPRSRRRRLDGSLHKAPYGGEGTGPNPTDRAKLGWKWSVASERHGVPIGWAIDGANRNDIRLLEPTLEAVARHRAARRHRTLHLDRGYDYPVRCVARSPRSGSTELEIQLRGTKVPGVKKQPIRLGLRWVVEATNTWWSNYGQLRRNTDRRTRHRHAALCLATTILIVGKTHQLARPLETRVEPYPLGSLASIHPFVG